MMKKKTFAIINPRIPWVQEETEIEFDGDSYTLYPWQTGDTRTGFILPTIATEGSKEETEDKLRRTLLSLAWVQPWTPGRIYIEGGIQEYYVGSHPPRHGSRRCWAPFTCISKPWSRHHDTIPITNKHQRFLFEACNEASKSYYDGSTESAFLDYYRVLEYKRAKSAGGAIGDINKRIKSIAVWYKKKIIDEFYKADVFSDLHKRSPGDILNSMRVGKAHIPGVDRQGRPNLPITEIACRTIQILAEHRICEDYFPEYIGY